MKLNFIYYLLISICFASCNKSAPNTFILEGEIDGLSDSTVIFLSYLTLDNDKWIETIDSAYVVKNKFVFKGDMNELTAAYLNFSNTTPSVRLYLEPTTMRLKLDKDRPLDYELSGTKTERENLVLREILKPNQEINNNEVKKAINIIAQINSHREVTPERDSLINILQSNGDKRIAIVTKINRIQLDYVLANKTSRLSCDLIYIIARDELIGIDTLKSAYNNMSEESRMSIQGKIAYKQIEKTERLQKGNNITEGSIAPNFSGKDFSGNEIKLSELYAKNYVLLDFWASWCNPCMSQIPSVREINNSYNDKGLKIIGLSSDSDTTKWKSTIEKFKLNEWTQILSSPNPDNDYFPSDISEFYGVRAIPCYFLIDHQGKVIAHWNHLGEEQVLFIKNLLLDNMSN